MKTILLAATAAFALAAGPALAATEAKTAAAPAATQAGTANIVATARADGEFSTLTKAIEAAGLTQELSAVGPYTFFAPTDAAFAKLPPEQLASLMQPVAEPGQFASWIAPPARAVTCASWVSRPQTAACSPAANS